MGEVHLNPTADLDGSLIRLEALNDLQPTYSNVNGEFTLPVVPHGFHDVSVSHPGYQSVVVEGVQISGSQLTANIGVIVLQGDTDGDGIADDADNCTLIANADQIDANGDGFGNACDPDLNDDGDVNFVDLGLMKAAFFGTDPVADLNGDGAVNFLDLAIMKDFFFGPPGPGGTVPLP